MPAITFYLANKIAEEIRAEAAAKGISLSRKISEVVVEHYRERERREAAVRFPELARVTKPDTAMREVHKGRRHDRV